MMLNFIRETFSSKKPAERSAMQSYETAQQAFSEDVERLRSEIAAISSQINIEHKSHTAILQQLSEEEPSTNQNLSTLSNEITVLKKEEALLLKKISAKKKALGIESAYKEINDLQEECRIYLDAAIIQVSALMQDPQNFTEDFQIWRESFGEWLKDIYTNSSHPTTEQLETEIFNLEKQIKSMPTIQQGYSSTLTQRDIINTEYIGVHADEEKIKEYRRQQAKEAHGIIAGFIRFCALFFSLLYILIAGDRLDKLSERKEELKQEREQLNAKITKYEEELSHLSENAKKLPPLKYQLSILQNCLRINELKIELSDLETDPELNSLLNQHEQKALAIKKAETRRDSLTETLDKSEQKRQKITLELNNKTANIIKLEEEKQKLIKDLERTLNTKEELTRLKQTEEARNPHAESQGDTVHKTGGRFAHNDLLAQDEISSDAGSSVESATTFESVSSESLVENPKTPKRYSFFNSRTVNSEDCYHHLLNRKIPNYSENPTFTPWDNIGLHKEQLNKSYMAITNIGIKIRALITKLEHEARAAQSISSETAKYAEEIDLFKELQSALNHYNIYLAMPSPNLELIQEKYVIITNIIATIKNKMDGSYPFRMQIKANDILLETINNTVLIAQKIIVSQEIEKYLQQITLHAKQATDTITKKKYGNPKIKLELEKYQALILAPTPNPNKLSEHQHNARVSLEAIKKLHTKLGLNIAPLKNALNAGRRIIGIYDEPDPSANIRLES